MRRTLWSMGLLAGLMAACQPRPECYGRYQALPHEGWAVGDTLRFCVTAAEAEGTCRLDLCLRTYPLFSKTGVMLMVRTRQHKANDDPSNTADTLPVTRRVAFPLSDSPNRPGGRGVALLQYRRPFLQLAMTDGDTLFVDVWPDLAPGDTLEGLSDVGVMLSR